MSFERRIETRYDASTQGFDRGTRRVEQQLARLQRTTDTRLGAIDARFARSARAVQGLGVAIGGLATAAGFRRLQSAITTTIDKLDNIAKSADAIGITTDALQELRVAADLSGVSAEQLDTGLRRFARVAADAGNGVKSAREAFAALGIEVRGTDGRIKSIEALVLEVSDGFAAMSDATQKAAAAQEFFGRGGVPFINLLNAGSAGIAQMREEARELGVIIDESLIRRSVIAQDELTLLSRVIDANMTVALAEMAPLLVQLTGFFADLSTALRSDEDALISFAGALKALAVSAAVVAGSRGIGGITAAIREGSQARRAAVVESRALVAETQKEVAARRLALVTLQRETAQRVAQGGAILNVEAANRRLAAARTALTAAEARAAAATNTLSAAQARLSATTRVATAAMGALRGALAFVGGVPGLIFAAAAAVAILGTSFRDAKEEVESAETSVGTLNSAVSDLESAQEAYTKAISATAGAQNAATNRIVADTKREFDAKRSLLELEVKRQQALQAERRASLSALQTQLAQTPTPQARIGAASAEFGAVVGGELPSGQAEAIRRNAEREIEAIQDSIKGLGAEAELAELAIEKAIEALNTAFTDSGGAGPVSETTTAGGGSRRAENDRAAERAIQDAERLEQARQNILASGREFIARQELEAEALFLTEEAANRLRLEFELLNDAQRAGIELAPLQAAELRNLAAEMAAAEASTNDLQDRMDFARDATRGFFGDLASGIRNGENIFRTFADAATRSLDRVIDKLLNELLDAIFKVNDAASGGGRSGGGILGAIGSIAGAIGGFFGGGGNVTTAANNPFGGGLFDSSGRVFLPVRHKGGVVGRTPAPVRAVSPHIFDGAPRMHSGGIAGLRPNEVPTILERGEIVVPNGASLSRGNTIINAPMTINIDRPGASVDEIERRLEPRLAAHREETIAKIRRSNNLNPRFLEG